MWWDNLTTNWVQAMSVSNVLRYLFHLFIFFFWPEALYQIRIQVLFPALHNMEFWPPLKTKRIFAIKKKNWIIKRGKKIITEKFAILFYWNVSVYNAVSFIHSLPLKSLYSSWILTGKKLAMVFQSFFPKLLIRILRFLSCTDKMNHFRLSRCYCKIQGKIILNTICYF